MYFRRLGKTAYQVSELGFGGWGIGGGMWQGGSDAESLAALRVALDAGVNFIDTALAYGDGHSERLVGQVVREASHRIYVATKVPPMNSLWPARAGIEIQEVFPYEYIIRCTDRSLKNLGLDFIDIQQLHVWNPEWIDNDEWRRAFEDLKAKGKVRYFGVSINDHDPDSALDVIKTGLIDTVQVIYNIFDQTPERNLFPLCQELDIGVMARVPLDEGSLAGVITEETEFDSRDFRSRYFRGDRRKQVVERVNALMADLGLESAEVLPEVALRFCLSHPAVSTVIPGMRTQRSVQRNIGMPGKGPLPEKTLEVLRRHTWDRNFYD